MSIFLHRSELLHLKVTRLHKQEQIISVIISGDSLVQLLKAGLAHTHFLLNPKLWNG